MSRLLAQPFVQAQIKENTKLRVTGLREGNSPVTSEFPAQRALTRKLLPFDDIIGEISLDVGPFEPFSGHTPRNRLTWGNLLVADAKVTGLSWYYQQYHWLYKSSVVYYYPVSDELCTRNVLKQLTLQKHPQQE